ncbi:MAG: hypothetical protein N3B01_08295, partial [Verrucomicrobiae bacterium]|nr:hypothetical protein [Verrucomicrobiae bacterium]
QDSLWVRPEPVTELVRTLAWFKDNPEIFVVLESRCIAGGADSAIVQGAWDFKLINDCYRRHLGVVADCRVAVAQRKPLAEIIVLLQRERDFYRQAVYYDPLLPR